MAKKDIHIINNPRITSEYGYRVHPVTGEKRSFHNGVDLVGSDTRLLAIHDGEIIEVNSDETAGNWIKVRYLIDGDEYIFSYCHLANSLSEKVVGHIVYPGEWIAVLGASGRVTAAHLHLTVRRNGVIVNPLDYFRFV